MAIKSTIIPDTTVTTVVQMLAAAPAATKTAKLSSGIKFSIGASGRLFWGPTGVAAASGKEIKDGDQIDPGAIEFLGDIYLVSDGTVTYNAEIVGQKVDLA